MLALMIRLAVVVCIGWSASAKADGNPRFIVIASTTSTQQSGLFDHILPMFRRETGIEVRVVAVGTGQALRLGMRGDADVVFVHDRATELEFVRTGFGADRREVMYNDFVIIGPKSDPAGIGGMSDVNRVLGRIAEARAPFVSRGDESGTHKAELRLWEAASVDLATLRGSWYRETGSGMGAALNAAAEMGAYILADRGTWLSFGNRRDLVVLSEGDPRLFNQYGVILVNPARHPHVREADGRSFIEWITGPDGQNAIGGHRIDGQQLFFPNAAQR